MPQVPFWVPLLLAVLAPAAFCLHLSPSSESSNSPGGGRHRQTHHWPRSHVVANHASQNSKHEIDSGRLRHALQQLLELNDGELKGLMSGMSPHAVAPRIEPSTAFLLASSRQYLERLNTILSTVEDNSPVKKSTWNPKIARRHKQVRPSHKKDFEALVTNNHMSEEEEEEEDVEVEEDPDSILSALTELSAYLSATEEEEEEREGGGGRKQKGVNQQERKRRSHHSGRGHKHQTFQAHGSSQYETRQYLYYLRSGECPLSGDGTRQMFCPSASASGEWKCIEDIELCDGTSQCPNEEDEAPTHCLFHNAMKTHLDELTRYILLSSLS